MVSLCLSDFGDVARSRRFHKPRGAIIAAPQIVIVLADG
jgi:hypothetical protein